MPRKPTAEHDFSKRSVNPPLMGVNHEGTFVTYDLDSKPFVLHRLPRQNRSDALEAIRELIGNGNAGYNYLPSVDSLVHVLHKRPAIVSLNWYTNFDHPVKKPFKRARREFFFIGEGDLGEVRGSWHMIACGYHKARDGREWIRLQNSWGHDYPLVWMPLETVRYLWDRDEFEACIAAYRDA